MVQERLTKLNHEIPLDFPPNVLAEAAELEKRAADLGGLKPLGSVEDALPIDRVSKASTSKRQDLRGVPFVTIDGEDARDFDDAVYVRRLPGAPDGAVWELWVAIADVSHFVLPGSRLDREAVIAATPIISRPPWSPCCLRFCPTACAACVPTRSGWSWRRG